MPGSRSFQPVESLLQQAVADDHFPGAVVWASQRGQVAFHQAVGARTLLPAPLPTTTGTLYDLASLTKPMATMTIAMALVARQQLLLEQPVWELLPAFGEGDPARRQVTIAHLLSHTSGLPDWRPLWQAVTDTTVHPTAQVIAAICAEPLISLPGQQSCYSDLGFILLGQVLAQVGDAPLEELFERHVRGPLGLDVTHYHPGNRADRPSPHTVAATSQCPRRGRLLTGEVHDDNAHAMGGVAGHAGLFGTAAEVGRWATVLLDAWQGREGPLDRAVTRRFLSRPDMPLNGSWTLGMDTPTQPSASGRYFSPHSVGHLGFTGTSVWIDLAEERIVVLLTNRVHPDEDHVGIRAFRPALHDRLVEALRTG